MIRVDLETIMLAAGPVPSVIVLRERNCSENMESPSRALTIQTGSFEAASLSSAMNEKPSKRPLTHDTYSSLLHTLNCSIDRIEIVKYAAPVFYCNIVFTDSNNIEHTLDARPSDALNLAVHFNAPIYVDEDIMNRMSSTKVNANDDVSELNDSELNDFLNNLSPEDF